MGVIWLLASRDPLLQQHNLERLRPEGSRIQLRWWPCWEPQRHGQVQTLVVARSNPIPPAATALDPACITWRWQQASQQWQSFPASDNSPPEFTLES
jgi:hypothetical protein